MRVRFVVVGKTNDPTVSEVELPFTIGRSEEADWRIPHSLVSRCHCQVYAHGGHVYVRDLDSLNGTFVGSERVRVQRIDPGELLTVGPITLRVEYEPGGDE